MPISKQAAQAQMDRMGQLSFPPKTRAEVGEILAALMLADSESIAEFFVSDWIDTQREWPKPYDVRAKIRDVNSESKRTTIKCGICGGSGISMVWFLVTYHHQSFKRKRAERIPDVHSEYEAQGFKVAIAEHGRGEDYQDVVSAAEPCICRRAIRSTAA